MKYAILKGKYDWEKLIIDTEKQEVVASVNINVVKINEEKLERFEKIEITADITNDEIILILDFMKETFLK